jgi:hypothetical protein
MWQHHYVIHQMRMEQLRAEADRERRWHFQDAGDGRAQVAPAPGRGRFLAARGIAALSRGAARVARRLDARVAVELGPDRLLRDA